MKKFLLVLVVLLAVFLTACNNEEYQIVVGESKVRVALDESYQVLATINPINESFTLEYSSNNPEILLINEMGVISPQSLGTTEIRIYIASIDIETIVEVEIYENNTSSLKIIGNSEIEYGKQLVLTVEYEGVVVDVDWEYPESLLYEFDNGRFWTLDVGSALVVATLKDDSSVRAEKNIEIIPNYLIITLYPDEDLFPGKKGYYLIARKESGVLVGSTNCEYEVANPTIASISEDGKITVHAVGETLITVSSDKALGYYLLKAGEIPVENVRNTIVEIAYDELGYREGPNNDSKYGTWYGMPNEPWCAMFVSWCAYQAGIPLTVIPKYAAVISGLQWFQGLGGDNYKSYEETQRGEYIPQCGDIIFFKSDGASHTGLVIKVVGDILYTIEGNTSDQVLIRWYYYKNYQKITGYGVPDYPPSQTDVFNFDISSAKYGGGASTH